MPGQPAHFGPGKQPVARSRPTKEPKCGAVAMLFCTLRGRHGQLYSPSCGLEVHGSSSDSGAEVLLTGGMFGHPKLGVHGNAVMPFWGSPLLSHRTSRHYRRRCSIDGVDWASSVALRLNESQLVDKNKVARRSPLLDFVPQLAQLRGPTMIAEM